jgi:MoaA/NifB/PqqE/SkfB family radical SAM enzyme
LQCSIDATGEASDYIRSGSTWNKISSNLEKVKDYDFIYVSINLTLSVLNIWFLQDVFEYAKKLSIPVGVIVLTGPDYLAIDVLPIELRALALDKLDKCQPYLTESVYLHCKNLIAKGENSYLFSRTLNHILLLDNLNQENLFNLLPFKEYAERIVIENFND